MLNSFFLKCWNHAEPPLSDPFENNAEYVESCPDLLLCTPQEIVQLIKGRIYQKLAVLMESLHACSRNYLNSFIALRKSEALSLRYSIT